MPYARICALLLACILLVSCSEQKRTGITLTIASVQIVDQALSVDRFAITTHVGDAEPSESEISLEQRAPKETETINLLFPPKDGGKLVVLSVRAMNGNEVQAEGTTEVELIKEKMVEASMLLRTCVAAEGAYCEDDVLISCDPVTDRTVRTACAFGCNSAAVRCNECDPGTAKCEEDVFTLCNDEGLIESNEDCTALAGDCKTGRCTLSGCILAATNEGEPCDDGRFCTEGTTCSSGICGGGTPRSCDDGVDCTFDYCDVEADECAIDTALLNLDPCDDGNFCTVGESCLDGECLGGVSRSCADENPCTEDICDSVQGACNNPNKNDDTPCEDGEFCTLGDTCQSGACLGGTNNPCVDANPCTDDICDETQDACTSTCTAAGSRCLDDTREVTCDGSCNATQLICPNGCNDTRGICNECMPSTTVCRAELDLLCNAEVVCGSDGLVTSRSCCSSTQCTCDGNQCLEDLCASSSDLSGGGNLSGDTCEGADNIPGDCNPGGTACQPLQAGGAPEEHFRFALDDGTADSAFYRVVLDSTASASDTALRLSTVCGNESRQLANAGVCADTPAFEPARTCSEQPGEPELLTLCGLPEGQFFGAVESASGACGAFELSLTSTLVAPDDITSAGNITAGGTFYGSTCGLNDDYQFIDRQSISGCTGEGDCLEGLCPACDTSAATDCTVIPNSADALCGFAGTGSPDAVFYLALDVSSGIDISTSGSRFDTVLYILEAGLNGMSPVGTRRVCNDDCWTTDGPSHIQTSLPAGLYFVVLDGAAAACGDYQLNVVVSPAATCPNLNCDAPFEDCHSCPLDCACPTCGNGLVEPNLGESCDDGALVDGDGCSGVCSKEPGYVCLGEPSACAPHCGNGIIEPEHGEACDDGNPFNEDGCSSACRREPSFWCKGEPSLCRRGAYAIACPEAVIPDGDSSGTTFSLEVPDAITTGDVNVDMDMTHTYIGDLTLELSSPSGSSVVLHNESGADADDIKGNYDLDLQVDDSATLDVFNGEPAAGTWELWVRDSMTPDAGVLHCWALNLSAPAVCENGICEVPQESCTSCPTDCLCQDCGDGIVDRADGEQCDDADEESLDGCDASCNIEDGYVCVGEPSVCSRSVRSTICPAASIPDYTNSPGILTSQIDVSTSCIATDVKVDVDITHGWIGDLIVELQSPLQTVRLHDRSGGSTANIAGNYDDSLTPDGPGSMADFNGLEAQGTWTLYVSDNDKWITGDLNCWTLNISCE